MTFEEFRTERYNHAPFDLPSNPRGFPPGRAGSSDISAHLPFIEFIALQCEHCTELGVRDGFSTVALLAGAKKRVVSYDIERSPFVTSLEWIVSGGGSWFFRNANTSSKEEVGPIETTDFLFVDTLHTYDQVKAELSIFSPHVRRFIGFHDTYSQGEQSLDAPGARGINFAIREFLESNPQWRTAYKVDFNHGLWLIEKSQ